MWPSQTRSYLMQSRSEYHLIFHPVFRLEEVIMMGHTHWCRTMKTEYFLTRVSPSFVQGQNATVRAISSTWDRMHGESCLAVCLLIQSKSSDQQMIREVELRYICVERVMVSFFFFFSQMWTQKCSTFCFALVLGRVSPSSSCWLCTCGRPFFCLRFTPG